MTQWTTTEADDSFPAMADCEQAHPTPRHSPHAPFGTYRLVRWRETLRAFGAGLVPRRFPRLGSILNWPIWRASLIGRSGPVDLEPYPGFALRLYPRENHADSKCYARPGLCDLPEEAAIARCAARGCDAQFIMVDVGANTGTYSVLSANLAKQAGRTPHLTCIEANPKTQSRLAANLHFSGLESCARIVPCAVSDAPGTVMLDTAQWNLGSVKVARDAGPMKAGKLLPVPARTLLEIVRDADLARIDFLKIDIEGHEVQALEPFLTNAPKELLPRMVLAETKHDKEDALFAILLRAGYRATHYGRSDTVFER
jgi:FkbM family methyltransferase